MMLDEYVAWVARRTAEDVPLPEAALAFAAAVGRVAATLAEWRRDAARRERLVEALGDVAHDWARLVAVTGVPPSMLLARSRAHVDWRRVGRPAGGPAPVAAPMALDEFTAWVRDRDGVNRLDDDLGDLGLALVGDAGEVVECLRELARGHDSQWERLAGELGDVWRHWTRLVLASGASPAALLERSRTALLARALRKD